MQRIDTFFPALECPTKSLHSGSKPAPAPTPHPHLTPATCETNNTKQDAASTPPCKFVPLPESNVKSQEQAKHITPDLLRVATVNVRGMQDSRLLVLNIMQGRYGPAPPHILIMTETKLINLHTKHRSPWLNMMRRTHNLYHSTLPNTNSPQAGVTIAIDKSFAESGNIDRKQVDAALEGFLLHLTIELPSSNPLHVLGVYCPLNTVAPLEHGVQSECNCKKSALVSCKSTLPPTTQSY